jgi:hypothetical protein
MLLVAFDKLYYDNQLNEKEMGGSRRAHDTEKVRTKLWLENLKERDNSEDLEVDRRIMKWVFLRKQVWRLWIGLIWLSKRSCGAFF